MLKCQAHLSISARKPFESIYERLFYLSSSSLIGALFSLLIAGDRAGENIPLVIVSTSSYLSHHGGERVLNEMNTRRWICECSSSWCLPSSYGAPISLVLFLSVLDGNRLQLQNGAG